MKTFRKFKRQSKVAEFDEAERSQIKSGKVGRSTLSDTGNECTDGWANAPRDKKSMDMKSPPPHEMTVEEAVDAWRNEGYPN